MARYPSTPYGRRRRRVRISIYITISALVVIAIAIIAFVYYPFGKKEDKTVKTPTKPIVTKEPNTPVAVAPPPKLQPKPQPEPKPKETEPEPNLPKIASEFVAEPNSQTAKLISKAMACINDKPPMIIEARLLLNDVLPMPMSRQQREFVKQQLSQLAKKWLFSSNVFPQDTLCTSYKVQPNEMLSTIGRQFKVPWKILQQINSIGNPRSLRAGQRIKVIKGPFHARIYRSTFTMDLYLQNTFVRSFPVGLAKPGKQTPTGVWIIKPGEKAEKPLWTDPDTGKVYHPDDPDYPLGSVWMPLKGVEEDAVGQLGYGIHGTNDPESIGNASSRGCIRLHNGDAIQIYNVLVETHSRVHVVK